MHVLDLNTGKVSLLVERAHNGGLRSLVITPDAKQLITGGHHRRLRTVSGRRPTPRTTRERVTEVRCWDIASGRRLREFTHEDRVAGDGAIRLSADGATLASSSYHAIHIWNVQSGEMLRAISTPGPHLPDSLAISPDGSVLARARFHTVDLWEVASGRPLLQEYGSQHAATIGHVGYSPDGLLIATGAEDGTVGIWDAKTGKRIRQHHVTEPSSMRLHDRWPMLVAFSPDGNTLAVGADLGPSFPSPSAVNLYNTTDAEPIIELSDPSAQYSGLTLLAFRSDGRQLAVAGRTLPGSTDEINVWELDHGLQTAELRPSLRPRHALAMAFLDDRTLCEVRTQSPKIRIWDIPSGNLEREIEVEGHWPERERRLQKISAAVFSPDHRQVITCGEDKLITWDLESGKAVSSIVLDRSAEERRIGISPDGRLLAISVLRYGRERGDDTIRLWDLTSGKQVLELQPNDTRAVSFAFSPDGQRLIAGMDNGTALVWDISGVH